MLRRWIGLTVLIASRICAASAIALSRILNKVWMAKPFDPRPLMAGVKKRFLLSEERFTFVVFGDTELKPGSERVFHFAEQLAPDFMIHLGDLVHRGADVLTRDWDLLAEQHGRLFRRIPFWPVIGNHEFRGNLKWANGSRFKQFFGLDRDYYRFDCGRFRFIILSWSFTEQITNGGVSHSPEMDWLLDALDSARGMEIILCLHRGIHTIGRDIPPVPELEDLCRQYRVRLVFSGHDHAYYRTRRDGVTYITSGLGGTRLHPLNGIGNAIQGDVYLGKDPNDGQMVWCRAGQDLETPFDSTPNVVTCVSVENHHLTLHTLSLNGVEIDGFTLDLSQSEEHQPSPFESSICEEGHVLVSCP